MSKNGRVKSSPSSTVPSKRKHSSNGNTSGKKSNPTSEKQQKLVGLVAKYNLAANELFQLREYSSLATWNPSDFSAAVNPQIPERFNYFIQENDYRLKWDANEENLNDIPLRLQKKKIAEREARMLELYPYKEDVLAASQQLESEILQHNTPAKAERQVKVKSEDPDLDSEPVGTNYKVARIKLSIPPPIITHPSHIPLWRPSTEDAKSLGDDHEHEIIDFHPEPIQVIADKSGEIHAPQVENKLTQFLTHGFKSAIIDESITADYNNTLEEYERITSQQEAFLKKLYEKVMIEQRFELNGDKIERRKAILPNTSAKLDSDPFRETGSVIPKIHGAVNNSTHSDYLLLQGMAFSRIHQQIRKQHQFRTRRIAQMIEQHFKKKKGEKERLQREREQNLKRISRTAVQAVKKRWGQAYKVYRYLQMQKEEELKKIKGREHLSQMLEHSTQLLEAQLNKSQSPETGENSDDDDSGSMSDSEESDKNPDMELSIDELRKKYADIGATEEEEEEEAEDEEEEEIEGNGLAALYGGQVSNSNGKLEPGPESYTEEQLKMINTQDEDPALEESESESGSESDLGSESESESESEAESEVEEEKPEPPKSGLASLLQNGDVSDAESDAEMSSVEEESDDNMTTTTDEEDEPKTPREPIEELEKEEEVNGTRVRDVPLPSLLRGVLRPYQKQGLNWLASLYNNSTNGILADEMGLGKTIQTISLLAYLACEHHIWGPHLIVVPTSVMLNWEMEFKKFAPGFKVLTYYGSPQQRAQKRKGWNKPDAFHVCITSYQLVVHDHQSFKRRRWRYMILDEAHNIKNFRSTRWRALLNFNTENRLLLTGTPLQNNLIELWSLLYFLMPSSKVNQAMPDGFANLEDFQQWFGRPVDKILEQASAGGNDVIDDYNTTKNMDAETKNTVSRLHQVLRPYLLRRLKKDVEKQMPGKYEHIVYCRLSKRQRYLYDDFMSRAKTKETLASGNFLSIINCLMQLRKVCNHPDLFEVRPIVTSYSMRSVIAPYSLNELLVRKLSRESLDKVSLEVLNLDVAKTHHLDLFACQSTDKLKASAQLEEQIEKLDKVIEDFKPDYNDHVSYYKFKRVEHQSQVRDKLKHALYLNNLRCRRAPVYGMRLLKQLQVQPKHNLGLLPEGFYYDIDGRCAVMGDTIEKYSIITPSVVALDMKDQIIPVSTQHRVMEDVSENRISNPFHKSQVKLSIAFPDKSLLQYDCGKLQKLATLMQDLIAGGHRALIFTQMTKVLDILEQFLNIRGYRYMRLDGATKIEDRQLLTEKFNRDNKIPVFILSTRSGGLGINLTGADTVIFYDSDWNPAMDKQCQDRCHRIGQSRDVHIYRFVSEYTIESNILKKANQKRQLDNVVIQEGEFTTDYFGKFSVKDLVNDTSIAGDLPDKPLAANENFDALAQAEDEDDRAAASVAMKEVAVDDEDFEETPAAQAPKQVEDEDFEDGVGHIDEYMLRFIAEDYYAD